LANAVLYHTILEQKKELEDSILYARRIQRALLPSEDFVQYYLPESFILYLPKAVVSGDFYWFAEQDGRYIYLAAVDCTGHGVPGAFMSVLVSNALSYAINEMGISDLTGILQVVDMQVRDKLQKQTQGEVVQDGAEMAILQIDLQSSEVYFAGAKRPLLWYSGTQRQEIPGTPRAIADDPELFRDVPFKVHKITPNTGDVLYIFSDGYADQEGSNKPRLGTRRFYELLDELQRFPLDQQARLLDQRLREWRGSIDQTDDILIIGLRYHLRSSGAVSL
jgi:serine phosphatase RsbU (regulator of sigma subunit)